MKSDDERIRDSRIAEALRQPVDAPDVTDYVMAHLPERPKPTFRWALACAAALLLVVLALSFALRPSRPTQIVKQASPKRPTVEHISRDNGQPAQRLVRSVGETSHHRSHDAPQRPKLRGQHHELLATEQDVPKKPQTAVSEETDQSSVAETAVMQAVLEQMRQNVRTLPPNEDAETIERPPLVVIENRGTERVPVGELGG